MKGDLLNVKIDRFMYDLQTGVWCLSEILIYVADN